MRLPTPLSRLRSNVHKNNFGHLLVIAGSQNMLGAAALTGLAAMRSGAGLVTVAVPKSLNLTLQKKISSTIMTFPVGETAQKSFALSAFTQIKKDIQKYDAIAIGPGLSSNKTTQKFVLKIIENLRVPMVIDADALNAITRSLRSLLKIDSPKILTPHPGEMARLAKLQKSLIEESRTQTAKLFAKKYSCTVLLKGSRTVVADSNGKSYTNQTGNAGMATAGSGDVLTGMIGAFLAQGVLAFEAAKFGAYLHGKAGDLAAKTKGKPSLIATDIIDCIPKAFRAKK